MASKICQICQTPNHRNASICTTCGATLGDAGATSQTLAPVIMSVQDYSPYFGETDLYEGGLSRKARLYMLGFVAFVSAVILVAAAVLLVSLVRNNESKSNLDGNGNVPVSTTSIPRATQSFPTVTDSPPTRTPSPTSSPSPTPTISPTPAPCMQEVQPNDNIFGLAIRCGHTSMDIVAVIAEINGLADANAVSVGTVLEIPWPTPTADPNALPTEDTSAPANESETSEPTNLGEDGEEVSQVSAFSENFDPLFVPTATLAPNIMIHEVQAGDTIISIGLQYGANVEILSQLNPEITFSQCDFGMQFGGQRCTVPLSPNQSVRVPAPTVAPTLSPTPSGSETPTPTATATFNAPTIQRPSDRAVFLQDELVTLRWNPTGTLAPEETYLIRVEDKTDGIVYTALTDNTSFIIPLEWQGEDEDRHEYEWRISVTNELDTAQVTYTTESLTFIWESKE